MVEKMVLMIILLMMLESAALGALYRVGDKQGWSPNVNYTEWSTQQHFYVGDWLLFNFDKRYYNVLEVNETSYEKCNDQGFIRNITRGGRDVIELTEARPYYFLSGGGYCFGGMKLVVNVELIHPASAPAPATVKKSSSPPKAAAHIQLLFILIYFLVQPYLCFVF